MEILKPSIAYHSKYMQSMYAQFMSLKLSYLQRKQSTLKLVTDQVNNLFCAYPSQLTKIEENLHQLTTAKNPNLDIIYDFENILIQCAEQIKIYNKINSDSSTSAIQFLKEQQEKVRAELLGNIEMKESQSMVVSFKIPKEAQTQMLIFEDNIRKLIEKQKDSSESLGIDTNKEHLVLNYSQYGEKTLQSVYTDNKYSEDELKQIMKQLALEIENLHKIDVIAANICPQNINCDILDNKVQIFLSIPNFNMGVQVTDEYLIDDLRQTIKIKEAKTIDYLTTSKDRKSDIVSFLRIMHLMTQCNSQMNLINDGQTIILNKPNSIKYKKPFQLLLRIIESYNRNKINCMDDILSLLQQEEFQEFYEEIPIKLEQEIPINFQQEIKDVYQLECLEHKGQKVKYQDDTKPLCFLCVMDIYSAQNQTQFNQQDVKDYDVKFKQIKKKYLGCQDSNEIREILSKNFDTSVLNNIVWKILSLKEKTEVF